MKARTNVIRSSFLLLGIVVGFASSRSGALAAGTGSALVAVRYVDVNSTNATPPYLGWATAATNIQDAVDAAAADDEIVVTNGIYSAGGRSPIDDSTINRVTVDKPLRVRSVNGPQTTTIDGGHSNRCVYLANGASLCGFTLANGAAYGGGGGLWCESTNAVVSNCVLSGNWAFDDFLRAIFYPFGGGVFGGTLSNCTLSNNYALSINQNLAFGFGGGAYAAALNNCTLSGNVAAYGGGACECTLNGCTLTDNSADGRRSSGGGADSCRLNNCTLAGNTATYDGGGAFGCMLNNCTLTGNSTLVFGGGTGGCLLNNCIVYLNTAEQGANYDSSSILNYSCTTPLPIDGVGNITNEPAFVNSAAGNYRLRPDSPCIDAGTNLSAIITNDLDGRPRPLDGNGDGLAAFDMGAYEYRTPLLVWQDSPDPSPPHSDWASAAHTIQDAIDDAFAGDEIVVTNGTYSTGERTADGVTTNRVAVDKPLSLRSVNGPYSTTIEGSGSVRCVYLTNNASLCGFTLTNGRAHSGGGLFCESTNAVVSNCVVSGNSSFVQYDFVFNPPCCEHSTAGASAGGVYGGTLNNCILNNNHAETSTSLGPRCDIIICRPIHDGLFVAYQIPGLGGGARNAILNHCTVTSNSAGYGGGAYGCTLNNCTLAFNSATAGNIFDFDFGGGAYECTANNCIVYYNTARQGTNYDSSSTITYSCTTPLPTNGVGNITNAPLFVDQASGNLRLQSNSPCINAGLNAFAPAGPDLDGNPRTMGGTVDMGAYEFQLPTSIISYAWLQQFNLPINPATDTADPDGDGVSNYREWLAGSDPTNPFSFAPLLTLIRYGANVILTWPTNAVGFTLQSTTNLVSPAAWATNSPTAVVIGGQNVITNPISGTQQFYRLSQ